MSAKKLLVKSFPFVFYGFLIIFIVIYFQTLDWSELRNVEPSWIPVVIATLLGLAARYWGAGIWLVILKTLGASGLIVNLFQLLYVYAKSWLGRYIPGTAPWLLGKIYFASQLGVSKSKLAVSSLLEGGLQLLVTLVLGVLILLLDRRVDSVISVELKLLMLGVLVAGVIVVIPKVFNWFFSIAHKVVKKQPFPKEHSATGATIIQGSSLYAGQAIVNGLSFFYIAQAVYPSLGYEELLLLIGASSLASAISMLAIFAPSGIGVREGIQVVLLALIMPVEVAVLVAVVTRLWSILVDLLFFATAYLMRRQTT